MPAAPIPDGIPGARLATTAAGIRYPDRDDLLLIELAPGSTASAVFTTNAFCAAPVLVARDHLATTAPRYLLINAGNANAGTGTRGLDDARACCAAVARVGTGAGQCTAAQVLPFSTGVIGEYLPVERITNALPALIAGLAEDGWDRAARAIMTTDTVPKRASRSFQVGGRTATVTGIAKGAGMIRPDMATMLAFVATDAAVSPALLDTCLRQAVAGSFNAISIDGDTSTNDACVLVATGALGNPPLGAVGPTAEHSSTGQAATARAATGQADAAALLSAISAVCDELATAIVRDGEGATKLVSVEVGEALNGVEARRVADAIAHSPLVKTALFASDPNWGRILAAVGRAGVDQLRIDAVRIWLDDVLIVCDGGRAPDYTEAAGRAVMAQEALCIRVALGRGAASARVLTCDLSYDYVRINAEYRT